MNANQRKECQAIYWIFEPGKSRLEDLRDELQTEFDEHSERWQEGEKGEALTERIEAINEHLNFIEDCLGDLDTWSEA